MTTPYVIICFADVADEPIVYLDNLTHGQALDDADYVDGYTMLHEKLRALALTPEESAMRMSEASRNLR
jgi:hypothetical protein